MHRRASLSTHARACAVGRQRLVGKKLCKPPPATQPAENHAPLQRVRAEFLSPRGQGGGDPMQPRGCGGESPHQWRSVIHASPTANPVGAKQCLRKDAFACRDSYVILLSSPPGTLRSSARAHVASGQVVLASAAPSHVSPAIVARSTHSASARC